MKNKISYTLLNVGYGKQINKLINGNISGLLFVFMVTFTINGEQKILY